MGMTGGWAQQCGKSAGQDSCWLANRHAPVSLTENGLPSHHASVSMSLRRHSRFTYRIPGNPDVLSIHGLDSGFNCYENTFQNKSHKSCVVCVCVRKECVIKAGQKSVRETLMKLAPPPVRQRTSCPSSTAVVSSTTAGSKSQAGNAGLHAAPTASVIASFPVVRLTHPLNQHTIFLINLRCLFDTFLSFSFFSVSRIGDSRPSLRFNLTGSCQG